MCQQEVLNLQYPAIALHAGISGSVQVKYTIDSEGKMTNISVMRGLSPECDAEAIRVTRLLTGCWEPGKRQGKPVDITVTMPVVFKSDKKTNPATISGKVTALTFYHSGSKLLDYRHASPEPGLKIDLK